MDLKTAREKAARAWCYPNTETKDMDPELCEQFALILHREIAELEGREKKTPEQVASEQSVKDWCKRQQNRMASTFGLQMEAQHILQVVYEYERYRAALREGEG